MSAAAEHATTPVLMNLGGPPTRAAAVLIRGIAIGTTFVPTEAVPYAETDCAESAVRAYILALDPIQAFRDLEASAQEGT